ncbi:MAG: baseplate J/gp47 family protein [Faecousia sp.]
MAEFTTPEFLLNHSTNENHQKMKSVIPADIDMSEGGHAWNMTRPTALMVAELCEFVLPEIIKLIFPEYSYGDFLDSHAKSRRMTRRDATASSGQITITGNVGTIIPAGSHFATASVNGDESVDYETLESAEIQASGTDSVLGSVTVDIQCTKTGIIGNTSPNTIVLVASRLTGIKSVTNEEAVTGGTEKEDDKSLIERIMAYDQSQGDNFVGSAADYKRWATEVPGVGSATIIPAQDTTGLVTIIITDQNGDPATELLCSAVYNHIMRLDSPNERLAPVNAYLKVTPPQATKIGIMATVELIDNATMESVKTAFAARLAAYLPVAMDDGEIKYTRVAAALASTDGVNDFSGLKIGLKDGDTVTYGTSNIAISSSQLPTIDIDDLALTAGTV